MAAMQRSETSEGVTRALRLLETFSLEEPCLGLNELSRRSQIAKTTTLRLLRTLEANGYVVQTEESAWRLGPSAASLSGRYQMAFNVRDSIALALRELSDSTQRDASFFVSDGTRRVRLIKVLYPGAPHSGTQIGESMPLDRGTAGKVILAAQGEPGRLFDEIRAQGFYFTVGESKKTSGSIATPVFGNRWKVLGALCIGAPATPDVADVLMPLAPILLRVSRSLSAALSYAMVDSEGFSGARKTTWYPSH
jgi:DNA-binding IclR family transcriptional regulator